MRLISDASTRSMTSCIREGREFGLVLQGVGSSIGAKTCHSVCGASHDMSFFASAGFCMH